MVAGLIVLCLTAAAHADRAVLVAGGGSRDGDDLPATEARLREPFGLDFDSAGNGYLVEMAAGERVLKLDRQGRLERVAGTGEKGDRGDGGPALEARFNGVHNLAIGAQDDIYLADTWNCRVRKIDARTGIISTVAGTGEKGYSGDGDPATAAKLGGIYCVAFDPTKENLYLADLHNLRVRVLRLKTGLIETVAGNGQKGIPPEGAEARHAPLIDPRAVAVDRQGRLYILERGGHALRMVNRDGRIRTVVGRSGTKGATGDGGPALDATLNGPKHLCLDPEGNVIIADAENNLIRKYLPGPETMVRVAGTGQTGARGVGGSPLELELARPHGVAFDSRDRLYIVDSYNDRVLRIEPGP